MLYVGHKPRRSRWACVYARGTDRECGVRDRCVCMLGSWTRAMHAESGRVERVGARRVRGLGMRIVERIMSEQAGVGCGVCVIYSSLLCTGSGVSWVVSHVAE